MSNTTTVKPEVKRGRPSTTNRTERPKRVPMTGARKKMHVDESLADPNFHYAWINDTRDLIFRAKRAGYEHVTVEEMPYWGTPQIDSANPTASLVSMPVGQGVVAYLMKQPMEFYEEDRAELDALNDAREADLKKELNSGKDGTYGKVEIKS